MLSPTAEPVSRSTWTDRFLLLLQDRVWLLLILIVLVTAVLSAWVPGFLSVYNLLNTSKYGVEIGLLALAETLIIISGGGGIDLSIGSAVSLISVLIGWLAVTKGVNVWLAALVGIAFGGCLGAVNGFLVSRIRIPPLLVTIGTMYIFGSLALVATGGIPISGFPTEFYVLGQGTLYGIPVQVIFVFIPVAVVLHFLLKHTHFGRHLVGVGTNEVAAHFAGIDVRQVRFWVYVIGGLLAGLAAVVMASRVATAKPDAGLGYELRAITIAVLGGTHIFGGKGTIVGTVLAVIIITLIANGLDLAMVHPIWQVGMLGIVLICSVLLNNWVARRFE